MGRSLSAKLVYGYDLGGGEDEWKIHEVDEDGTLAVSWYDDDEDDADFATAAEDHLLNAIGFTEKWGDCDDDGYFGREREAKARLGVKFEWYGLSDYSETLLIAHEVEVCGAMTVDPGALANHPDLAKWDTALASAITALGITPTQDKPGWILCAYYG